MAGRRDAGPVAFGRNQGAPRPVAGRASAAGRRVTDSTRVSTASGTSTWATVPLAVWCSCTRMPCRAARCATTCRPMLPAAALDSVAGAASRSLMVASRVSLMPMPWSCTRRVSPSTVRRPSTSTRASGGE
ncbi:hypothetical protein B0E53_03463 [Micromonospora sp. MH33]|nr:hypothetical protein B0E53_03463 [Micromonospora sp. MH33]